MHFSAQEEYGLRCVIRLALHQNGGAVSARQISDQEKISLDYVHKLLGILKRRGLIKSMRGINGGFRLVRNSRDITVGEVLEMLCSEINSDGHCGKFNRDGDCPNETDCKARPFWNSIYDYYEKMGKRVTLQQLIDGEIKIDN